jgi:hypothetical protein
LPVDCFRPLFRVSASIAPTGRRTSISLLALARLRITNWVLIVFGLGPLELFICVSGSLAVVSLDVALLFWKFPRW